MKNLRRISSLVLFCASIVSHISADEVRPAPAAFASNEGAVREEERSSPNDVRPLTEEEQEQVGKRKLPATEELSIQARRAKDSEKESASDLNLAAKSFDQVSIIHPDSYHYPYSHSMSGDQVELYNGSVWFVHPWDRYKVMNWLGSDLIFIRPNPSWFSSYKYVLENQATGAIVDVNLIAPPYINNLWVVNIDTNKGVAVLCDGTVWPLNGWDYNVYNKWYVGDRIIVGINTPARFGIYPYILINVEIDNYSESSFPYQY